MPKIQQYFAPARRLTPSERGFAAQQEIASAEERSAQAAGREGETWAQAARRLGSISEETAASYRAVAAMQRQQGTLLRQGDDLTAENIKNLRGLEQTPARTPQPARVKIGNPNGLLDNIHRADTINTRRDNAQQRADDLAQQRDQRRAQLIAAHAAALFGRKPVIPRDTATGLPLYTDSAGNALTSKQEGERLRVDRLNTQKATQFDRETQWIKDGGYNPLTPLKPGTEQDQDVAGSPDGVLQTGVGGFDPTQPGGTWWDGLKTQVDNTPPAADSDQPAPAATADQSAPAQTNTNSSAQDPAAILQDQSGLTSGNE